MVKNIGFCRYIFYCLTILFFLTSCSQEVEKRDYDLVEETSEGTTYMVASWYGEKFHGRPTSSGEIYDMYGLTAAHKTLPFGTKLKILNPFNGKTIKVVINDRGPFIEGRELDLSYGAAKALGMLEVGVAKMKIDFMGRDLSYTKRALIKSDRGPYTIQVSAFSNRSNASRLKQTLDRSYKKVYIVPAVVNDKKIYRVRIGEYSQKEAALRTAEHLAEEGYATMVVTYE